MEMNPKISEPVVLRIDCDTCQVRLIECGDCVVAALIGQPSELTKSDLDSIQVLSNSGLVPPLRLVVSEDQSTMEPQ
ncbi:MAG: hypothetical protein ACO3DX_00870 [Candidatus Nanopelagicales bacterium]